jgi:hypothetical protein
MIRTLILLAAISLPVFAGIPTVVQPPNGGRVPEVALDNRGVWHVTYGLENDGYYVSSRDNGATFSNNEIVKHAHPGLACACCRLEARTGADGNVYVLVSG